MEATLFTELTLSEEASLSGGARARIRVTDTATNSVLGAAGNGGTGGTGGGSTSGSGGIGGDGGTGGIGVNNAQIVIG